MGWQDAPEIGGNWQSAPVVRQSKLQQQMPPEPELQAFMQKLPGIRNMPEDDFRKLLASLQPQRGEPLEPENAHLIQTVVGLRTGRMDVNEAAKRLLDVNPARREISNFVVDTAGLFAGGAIGGTLGRMAGLTSLGRIIGTGAGGAGAVKLRGGSNAEAAFTGALGAGSEALGALAGKFVRGGFLAKQARPGAGAALKDLSARGQTLTPALATDNFLVSAGENVAAGSLVGGSRVAAARTGAIEAAATQVDDVAKALSFGASREAVGEVVQDAISNGIDAFKNTARGYYRVVDKRLGSAVVDIQPLKTMAKTFRSRFALRRAGTGALNIIDDVLEQPRLINFEQASILRSELLSVGRGTAELMPGKAQGYARALAKTLDGNMQTAAKKVGGPALDAWRAANNFWKQGKDIFNSRIIRSLSAREPDVIFDAIMRSKSPTVIRRVRNIITGNGSNLAAWDTVQGAFMQNVIAKSLNDTTGLPVGTRIARQLRLYGDDTLKEMVPNPRNLQNFKRAVQNLTLAQSQPAEGTGKVFIQLSQAGAIFGLFTGNLTVPSAGVLLAPPVLARVMMNPNFTRWLIAYRMAPNAVAANRAATKLTQLMIAAGGQAAFPQEGP